MVYQRNQPAAMSAFFMWFLTIPKDQTNEPPQSERLVILIVLRILREKNHNFGPAATKALPASFVVNFSKFLMKREERSLAFSSQAFLSA